MYNKSQDDISMVEVQYHSVFVDRLLERAKTEPSKEDISVSFFEKKFKLKPLLLRQKDYEQYLVQPWGRITDYFSSNNVV